MIGRFLIVLALVIPFSVMAEAPRIHLSGFDTYDAIIEVEWPNASVTIEARELEQALELKGGLFFVDEQIVSAESGIPALEFHSDFDDVLRYIHFVVYEHDGNKVLALRYEHTGKTLTRVVEGSAAGVSGTARISQENFSVDYGVLNLPGTGTLELSKVLPGGRWVKITEIAYSGYDGVVQWQCDTPQGESDDSRHQGCFCEDVDPEADDPTCWGYQRTARVAFRRGASPQELEAVVFHSNFDGPDEMPFLRQSGNKRGEVNIFSMEPTGISTSRQAPESERVNDASHCGAGEHTAFNCHVGDAVMSLCIAGGEGVNHGDVKYRFGRLNDTESVVWEALDPPSDKIFLSRTPYSGGGEARVRFSAGMREYVMFSRLTRGSAGEDGTGLREMYSSAGMLVLENKKEVDRFDCNDGDAGFNVPDGYLREEDFDDDLETG